MKPCRTPGCRRPPYRRMAYCEACLRHLVEPEAVEIRRMGTRPLPEMSELELRFAFGDR